MPAHNTGEDALADAFFLFFQKFGEKFGEIPKET